MGFFERFLFKRLPGVITRGEAVALASAPPGQPAIGGLRLRESTAQSEVKA